MDRSRRRSGPPPGHRPGGGPDWRPSLVYLAIALLSLAGGLAFLLLGSPAPALPIPVTQTPAASPSVASASTRVVPVLVAAQGRAASAAEPAAADRPPAQAPAAAPLPRPAPRAWEPDSDPTPDLSNYLNPGEAPAMAEVIERLHRAGIYGGLGAFSPPGTKPPLLGLAVPEDFELPAGYVRHHQATDDGQRIEPILMFSPDYAFVDTAGGTIAVPADRVVPPELAPPGLPIRRIVVPGPAESGRPTR